MDNLTQYGLCQHGSRTHLLHFHFTTTSNRPRCSKRGAARDAQTTAFSRFFEVVGMKRRE
jgi:hypothetical protein